MIDCSTPAQKNDKYMAVTIHSSQHHSTQRRGTECFGQQIGADCICQWTGGKAYATAVQMMNEWTDQHRPGALPVPYFLPHLVPGDSFAEPAT